MNFNILKKKIDCFFLFIKSIRLSVLALSCIMLFIIFCNSKYFTIGDYFVFPIGAILLFLYEVFKRCRKKEKFRFDKEHYYILFILFYTIAIRFLSSAPQKNDTFFTFLIFWMIIFIGETINITLRELRFLLKMYLLSAIILSIVLIVQHRLPYSNEMRFTIFYNSNDFYDVNFLAAYLVFPALIFVEKFFCNLNKKKYHILLMNSFGFVLTCVSTVLTGSRGSFVVLIVGVSYIVIKNYDKYNFKILLYAIPFLIIIVFLFFPKELVNRFLLASYNDGSNQKRLVHWILALQTIRNNYLFGYGMIWTIDVIHSTTGSLMTAHNTILGFLLQYGLIGSLAIAMWGLTLVKTFIQYKCYLMIFFIFSLAFVLIMIEAQTSLVFLIPALLLTIIQRYIKNQDMDRETFENNIL